MRARSAQIVSLVLFGFAAMAQAAPTNWVQTIAGFPALTGTNNGTGASARFNTPLGMVMHAGYIYVAEWGNHDIRRVSPSGQVEAWAGTPGQAGLVNGDRLSARFQNVRDVYATSNGTFYVSDCLNHCIRQITPEGIVSTLAGSGVPGSADGIGTNASFNEPAGLTMDASGYLWVVDSKNNTIRKIDSNGTVTTVAGQVGQAGGQDGPGHEATFNFPLDIVYNEPQGLFFVTEWNNHDVRMIQGDGTVSTYAGFYRTPGADDGPVAEARFNQPYNMEITDAGDIYLAEWNHQIRHISPDGIVSTIAGQTNYAGTFDAPSTTAWLMTPTGVALSPDGSSLYFAQHGHHCIRVVHLDAPPPTGKVGVRAGRLRENGYADGVGTNALCGMMYGIASGPDGMCYVADYLGHTIRKLDSTGALSTWAGRTNSSGSADGVGANAQFNWPQGLAVDAGNRVFVADRGNHTIRMITPDGTVSTIAGQAGVSGSSDGTGNAAHFAWPAAVAADRHGLVYVADGGNQTIRRMEEQAGAWNVTTLAGTSGSSGTNDGQGADARFNNPVSLSVGADGTTLYVVDRNNHSIRMITPDGTVSTYAGTSGQFGWRDGDRGQSLFSTPQGITQYRGVLYISDGPFIVRKIASDGQVSTLAGYPNASGMLNGSPIEARFLTIEHLTVAHGMLLVVDRGNYAIRQIPLSGDALTWMQVLME